MEEYLWRVCRTTAARRTLRRSRNSSASGIESVSENPGFSLAHCELRPVFFLAELNSFPGPLWTFGHRLVPSHHAIILIGLTHRSQRLVVQTGQPKTFFQFLAELL